MSEFLTPMERRERMIVRLQDEIAQLKRENEEFRERKWPDDLEAGFTYAMQVAKLSGASDAVLDEMARKWNDESAMPNQGECFHCGEMQPHFAALRAERLAARNELLKAGLVHGTLADNIRELSTQRAQRDATIKAVREYCGEVVRDFRIDHILAVLDKEQTCSTTGEVK